MIYLETQRTAPTTTKSRSNTQRISHTSQCAKIVANFIQMTYLLVTIGTKTHFIKSTTPKHNRNKNTNKMAAFSTLKNSNPLHIFSMKPSSPPPISKLKTLFQTLIFSHMYRAARALSKAKSLLLEHVRDMQFLHLAEFRKSRNCKKKLFFGSFRLHYNWCTSHVMPLVQESYQNSRVYYDASCNVVVPTSTNMAKTTLAIPDGTTSSLYYREPEGLSRYLEWLEEEKGNQESRFNEIDKLADLFIADCHEKFRLEKQESYRIFQEMMARSV